MGAEKSLKAAEAIFLALLTIGLMGLLFLIIYGNLSGNLGWTQDSASYANQTINLTGAGNIPAGAQGRVDGSLSSVVITNATGPGHIVDVGNYTITGVVINSSGATGSSVYLDRNVNVSFVVAFDGTGERNTNSVIANLTSGATQFFSFSSVWFILTAITILIGIVLGVISLVRKSSGGGFSGKESRSEFSS